MMTACVITRRRRLSTRVVLQRVTLRRPARHGTARQCTAIITARAARDKSAAAAPAKLSAAAEKYYGLS